MVSHVDCIGEELAAHVAVLRITVFTREKKKLTARELLVFRYMLSLLLGNSKNLKYWGQSFLYL